MMPILLLFVGVYLFAGFVRAASEMDWISQDLSKSLGNMYGSSNELLVIAASMVFMVLSAVIWPAIDFKPQGILRTERN